MSQTPNPFKASKNHNPNPRQNKSKTTTPDTKANIRSDHHHACLEASVLGPTDASMSLQIHRTAAATAASCTSSCGDSATPENLGTAGRPSTRQSTQSRQHARQVRGVRGEG